MTNYRLRVETPAQPLASRHPAEIAGTLGGELVTVDLHEVDGTHMVDEIVVDFHQDPDTTALHRALESDPGATLLSTQRCGPSAAATEALDWVRTTGDIGPGDAAGTLPHQLSVACPLSQVAVRAAPDVASIPVVRMAVARGGPVVHRCAGILDDAAERRETRSAWVLAVADRYPTPQAVALLSRPLSLRFSAHEVARVEALMGSTTTTSHP